MNFSKKTWALILTTAILASAITVFQTEYWGSYGFVTFLFVPLLIGLIPIYFLDENEPIRKSQVVIIGLTTLSIFSIILVLIGIEGMICIAMAAPIGTIITLFGSFIAYILRKNRKKEKGLTTTLIMLTTLSLFSYVDKNSTLSLNEAKTSIVVEANINTVWNNVITFPKLSEPKEYLFKTGISYPIEATIAGKGKGAIRYCKFNTGDFIEPITEWNEPNLLAFNVDQQPLPMKELSMYDIDAPHLHDYFLSKKGQFKLTKLSNNRTLLEGTTWYTHNIRPEFYWKLWSNYIIHRIHLRVLENIKSNSEKN